MSEDNSPPPSQVTLHNLERVDIINSLEIELEALNTNVPILAKEGPEEESKAAFARQAEVAAMLAALRPEETVPDDPAESGKDPFLQYGRWRSATGDLVRQISVMKLPTGCVLRTTLWSRDGTEKQVTETLQYLPGVTAVKDEKSGEYRMRALVRGGA